MLKQKFRACLTAGLVTTALATTFAQPAEAGTYRQHTCKLPDGSPAATDGWTPGAPAAGFSVTDDCGASDALRIGMQRGLVTNSERTWLWTAPADTTLEALAVYRAFSLADGSNTATPNVRIEAGSLSLEDAGTSAVVSNGVRTGGAMIPWHHSTNRILLSDNALLGTANQLRVALSCIGGAGASCPSTGTADSEINIHAASFTLRDAASPVVTAVGGNLASAGSKSGIQQLTFNATDAGAGIYRTILTVDGTPTATSTPDTNGGKCVDAVPSDPDPYEFEHRVPCPLQLNDFVVPLDTRTLSDGNHIVEVEVEDASGNRRSAFGPSVVEVRNAAASTPPPSSPAAGGPGASSSLSTVVNGVGGGPGARLSVVVVQSNQRLVRVPHGRSVTLSGRLVTQSGAPVAGAEVEVLTQTRAHGARVRPLAKVRTDASGAFRYVLRPGPSRLVRFGYRARLGDTAFSHTTDVDVRVRAKVSMRPSHTRLRNGQMLRYSGRVFGERTARPLVQIQVRNRGRWVNVCVVRTKANGAYSCRYRFRRTFRPTTYTFRALVRAQAGLPYETAGSPRLAVRVRP